ncbi:MAG: AAA family ATPase [Euzebya tangerina]|nr:MoxR family ATPase [Euzebya tangerina]
MSTSTDGTTVEADDIEVLDPGMAGEMLTRVRAEIGRVIVGQQRVVERVLVSLLAGGHCLLEGAPGLGKTRLLTTLATTLGGSFNRIQFTPDLLPSDIVGTRIWQQEEGRFSVELGPVFANFVLTDEINRAPAKVQSALLEVMAEQQVTIGGETFEVDRPFLVLATQNPIESEGVYQLPEAQRDRFLMKVPVDYPAGPHEEMEIVRRAAGDEIEPREVIDLDDVRALQTTTRAVHVDPRVADYAVRLVMATREPRRYGLDSLTNLIAFGASPRASIGLIEGARALALLRGRGAVDPQDIYDIGYDVLNHRLVLSFDAVADGVSVDEVLYHLLTTIPAPTVGGAGPANGAQGAGNASYRSSGVVPAAGYQPGASTPYGQPTMPAAGHGPTTGGVPSGPPIPPTPTAGVQAASPYGGGPTGRPAPYTVVPVTGEFQGQRDTVRGDGRGALSEPPAEAGPLACGPERAGGESGRPGGEPDLAGGEPDLAGGEPDLPGGEPDRPSVADPDTTPERPPLAPPP